MISQPIVLTAGEPAGIGYDLCVLAAQRARSYPLLIVADADTLLARAKQLALPLVLHKDKDCSAQTFQAGHVRLFSIAVAEPVIAGQLNPANAQQVLDTLAHAVQGCLSGHYAAMVTAPVHKGVINRAGIAFTGHTEFLAQHCGDDILPVMMLTCPGLRVALVTTHLPLSAVSHAITPTRLQQVLQIVHHDLQQKMGLANPHIVVAGLNPHAGEDGYLGREEIEIINPVLAQLRAQGMHITGALPADTLFTPHYLEDADVVVAMYHDQGLPVLKYRGFGEAVNITLGLPIIRTSVDHGTALDLAGTGKINLGSLWAALNSAQDMSLTYSRAG